MTTRNDLQRGAKEQADRRSRLTIDVSPEMRRRIKIAAAQQDMSVREYVARILDHAVPAESTKAEQNRPQVTRDAAERLLQTRDQVMHGRIFADDSTDLLREARDERVEEL